MKTANDILEEQFKRVNPEKDFYIFKTEQPEQYEAMIMAMNEYASQFIHPKDCYQCEGTGNVVLSINPDGQDYTQTCMICKGTGKLIILPMQNNT